MEKNNQLIPYPHTRCNWVIKNKILMGARPVGRIKGRLNTFNMLLNFGVKLFINLDDKYKNPWYLKKLPIDVNAIIFPIKSGNIGDDDRVKELLDKIIEFYDNNGGIIYIHCHGGFGRAGTIAACLLGKLEDLNCQEAVEKLQILKETRIDKSRNVIPMPETNIQISQIARIIGYDKTKQLPDRSNMEWLNIKFNQRFRKL